MRSPNEKQKFLDTLEEIPIVLIAAKRCAIAKSTIYRWRKNKVFAKKMDESLWRGRDGITDVVESQLVKQAKDGDFKSQKLWLENNCKRYVKPRPQNFFITEEEMKKMQKMREPIEIVFKDFSETGEEDKTK